MQTWLFIHGSKHLEHKHRQSDLCRWTRGWTRRISYAQTNKWEIKAQPGPNQQIQRLMNSPLIAKWKSLALVLEYKRFQLSRTIGLGGSKSRVFFGFFTGAASSSSTTSGAGVGFGAGAAFSFFGLGAESFLGASLSATEGFAVWGEGNPKGLTAWATSPTIFLKLGWLTRVQKYLSTWGYSEVNSLVAATLKSVAKLQVRTISASVTDSPTKYVRDARCPFKQVNALFKLLMAKASTCC